MLLVSFVLQSLESHRREHPSTEEEVCDPPVPSSLPRRFNKRSHSWALMNRVASENPITTPKEAKYLQVSTTRCSFPGFNPRQIWWFSDFTLLMWRPERSHVQINCLQLLDDEKWDQNHPFLSVHHSPPPPPHAPAPVPQDFTLPLVSSCPISEVSVCLHWRQRSRLEV